MSPRESWKLTTINNLDTSSQKLTVVVPTRGSELAPIALWLWGGCLPAGIEKPSSYVSTHWQTHNTHTHTCLYLLYLLQLLYKWTCNKAKAVTVNLLNARPVLGLLTQFLHQLRNTHACTHVCTHARMHTHIHTYTHICLHRTYFAIQPMEDVHSAVSQQKPSGMSLLMIAHGSTVNDRLLLTSFLRNCICKH